MLGEELGRRLRARVALALRPDLDLSHELAQLAEQHARLGVRTVERLDPLDRASRAGRAARRAA